MRESNLALGDERPVVTQEWAARIAAAQSEELLVSIANEYLATWLPSDLEALPAECRVSSVSTANELANCCVAFVKSELSVPHDAPASATLAALVRIFVAAQERLRQLRSRKYDPSPT